MTEETILSPPPALADTLSALRAPGKKLAPEKQKPEIIAACRSWLAARREAIKAAFLADDDAAAMLAAYSKAMDELLAALFELKSSAASVTLFATGGYGRGELFPYSDIDILFLYEGKNAAKAAQIAEFILYILWDLGLKVGHAHRTLDETIAWAKSDISVRSGLLDARYVAGDAVIHTTFLERFEAEIIMDTEAEFVECKLAERKARHTRFGESRYMLEPNVKDGKGGLRDLHTLWWLAHYCYRIRAMQDLVGMGLLTEEEYKLFFQARQFLWRVRIHLHYLAESGQDRLTFDYQKRLAVAMGFHNASPNRAIERFMRRYFAAVRTVGSMTRIFCALMEDSKKRAPRKSLAWLWYAPWRLGHFKLDGERLTVRTELAFEVNPVLMIELFRVAQINDLDIHPHALQLMARNLHRIDDALRHDSKANALFMDILLAYQGPEIALRRMSEAGVLSRFIPDFGRIIGQTQFNMYHIYTVDEHTLVALGILHAIEKRHLREELPVVSSIINRIQMRGVLYLSLFCHDIAKGRGGDHSALGERIAAKLAKRFGFSQEEIETAAWLVRHHLLFSDTAFKRDIDDPKTIQDFVAVVQSPERLKLLLALTVADIRAVGPGIWNGWKASLLRELFRRAEESMGAGEVVFRKQQAGQFREDLQLMLPGWSVRELEAYLEQGNPTFWMSLDPARHATIARMMKEIDAATAPLLVDTQHDYECSVTEIIICTFDRQGLFACLAGAIALAGANIINAKVFTLKNGIAVDVFQVQDTIGQLFDRPDKLAKMSVYIEQVLTGELDLAIEFARAARPLANPSHSALPLPGQVFIENSASHIYSVIELTGHDRSGFLYDVTRTLAELGLSIATAHISTYGTQAADVFYVKDNFGMKITHEARMKEVREKLLKAIGKI